MTLNGSFSSLPLENVHFGPGSLGKLAAELDTRGVSRAVVVTGRSIAGNAALMARLHAALGSRIAGIVSDTKAHLPRSSIIDIVERVRALNADGLISFGGGSANDTMKATAWALAEDIRTVEGFDAFSIKFEYPDKLELPEMTRTPLPTFAIATTLSAAEFTGGFAMTDDRRGVKDLFRDNRLGAKAVILDPELTLATPERLWLATGLRAIDHCIEALLSNMPQPYTDAMAAHALGLLHRNLPASKRDPLDLEARTQCMVAAWLSFIGVANVSLGLSHGVGHQLGARCEIPHGETSCIMLHNVMDYNLEATLDRQAWIAEILGAAIPGDRRASAEAASKAILSLVRDTLGLPWRLRDVGMDKADIPLVAQDAMGDLVVAGNPRPVGSATDIVGLLEKAW